MKIFLKGERSEIVHIQMEISELALKLRSFLGLGSHEWIAQSKRDRNRLAVWGDVGGSHYDEDEIRYLTEEETEYYNALCIIEKHLLVMDDNKIEKVVSKQLNNYNGKQKR